MKFGENPNKVRNIVDKQIKEFHQLYTKIMLEDEDIKLVVQPAGDNKWKVNIRFLYICQFYKWNTNAYNILKN